MDSLTLERVLNLVPAKIAVLDSELKYVFLNDALAGSLGVSKASLLGSGLGERNHPNSDALKTKLLTISKAGSSTVEFRLDFLDSKGEFSPHHFYLSYLRDESLHKYVILSIDVTKQVSMEVGLEKKLKVIQSLEQYLQSLINTIPNPIYVRGKDQRWIDANDAFLKLIGMTKQELVDSHNYHYLGPISRVASAEVEERVLAETGAADENEEEVILADGAVRYFSTKRQSRVLPDGRQVVIGILHDLTEQKRREVQVEQSAKLHHFSSRLDSLSQMASRISHEINNPLTIIKLTANAAAERVKRGQSLNTDQVLKAFSDVESASDRIAKLLLAMRAIAKPPEEGEIKSFVVGSVIEKTLPFCLEVAERKDVAFNFVETPERNRLVVSSEPAFSQALLHVVKNAYEALAGKNTGKVELRVEGSASWVSVFVKDNGEGISEANASRVFDPFFSTKSRGKGLGLGLSLSRQNLRASGGDLSFRTGPWGAEFEIKLPAAGEANRGK